MFTSGEVRALKSRENRFRRPWRLFGQARCARTKPSSIHDNEPRARRAKQVEAAAQNLFIRMYSMLHYFKPTLFLNMQNVCRNFYRQRFESMKGAQHLLGRFCHYNGEKAEKTHT